MLLISPTEDLDDEVRVRLGKAGVRRILEWEVHYLQGLAESKRAKDVTVVAGGHGPAVEYIEAADRPAPRRLVR